MAWSTIGWAKEKDKSTKALILKLQFIFISYKLMGMNKIMRIIYVPFISHTILSIRP